MTTLILLDKFSKFLESKPPKALDVCSKCSRTLDGHKLIWCMCGGKFTSISFKRWIDYCDYRLLRTPKKDRKRMIGNTTGEHQTIQDICWFFEKRLSKEDSETWRKERPRNWPKIRDLILGRCVYN